MKKAIIFIPGYKGSILTRIKDNRRIWLTISETIFGNNSLKLSLIDNDKVYEQGGVLKSVSVIPGLLKVDFYESFLNDLSNIFKNEYKIINFSYDWRMDIIDSVIKLNELIDSLKNECSISLMAHSMGGMIVSYFLRYGSQPPESGKENWYGAKIIDKVILAGVPFHGSAEMFCEIQNGFKVAFNDKLLSFEASSSFPSIYQLLPSPDVKFIIKNKKYLDLTIYDSVNWEIFKWGLFKKNDVLSEEIINYKRFLDENLNRANKLKYLLNVKSTKPFNSSIKILNLIGVDQKTITGIDLSNECAKYIYNNGDGTVSVDSAKLPAQFTESFVSEEIKYKSKHRHLYSCKYFQKKVFNFLLN